MNDLITLITTAKVQDVDLEESVTTNETEIIGDIEDTKRTEFYAAMAANHKVSKTIDNVNVYDYELAIVEREDGKKIRPQQVRIDGEVYDIIRTYAKDTFNMQIVCEEVDL